MNAVFLKWLHDAELELVKIAEAVAGEAVADALSGNGIKTIAKDAEANAVAQVKADAPALVTTAIGDVKTALETPAVTVQE